MDGDKLGLRQGNLAIQDGIRHGIAGLDHSIHGVQIRVQLVQVYLDGIHIAVGSQYLHGLDMVAVVMPPATNLPVHIVHFPVVGFD